MQLFQKLKVLLWLLSLTAHSQDLVSSDSWTLGSGSVAGFTLNGSSSENIRELGISPHGQESVLWKAIPDAGGNASGGWQTDWFAIDRTKMYRFSVWIKKTNSNDGTTYFGCYSNDVLTLSGAVNPNPYFWAGDLPALNKWYLLVGYVHAYNDPSTINHGGIYDIETGAKVFSITDFKFSTSATSAAHRAYLYYDVNINDRQFFYGPQVHQVDKPYNESNWFQGNAFFNRKVSVGTASPYSSTTLHLKSDADSPWSFVSEAKSNSRIIGLSHDGANGMVSVSYFGDIGFSPLQFRTSNIPRMTIDVNGNIGVGTISPSEKLTVHGTIYGKEVKVDLSVPGPDYVFENDYNLPSLQELQKFIDRYKHLPEIPSAKEMESNGIELGVMNMLLLKKIEELTLYVIELKKENEKQDEVIQHLQRK